MQPAVIYSRVSTNKQDADNQIKVMESWAKDKKRRKKRSPKLPLYFSTGLD